MKLQIFRTRPVQAGALAAVIMALAYQNCGRSFTLIEPEDPVGFARSNGVAEAGLSGVDVISPGSLNEAVSGGDAVSSSTDAVVCSKKGGLETCGAVAMPVLYQRIVKSPDADMYCAPTSSTMVFEALRTNEKSSGAEWVRRYYQIKDPQDRILETGKAMKTSSVGTTAYDLKRGMQEWIQSVQKNLQHQTLDPTPEAIANGIRAGGLGVLVYVQYQAIPVGSNLVFRETLSHAVALKGFEELADGGVKITYQDPMDKITYSRKVGRDPSAGKFNLPVTPGTDLTGYYLFKSEDEMTYSMIVTVDMVVPASSASSPPAPAAPSALAADIKKLFDQYLPGCWSSVKQEYWEAWFGRGGLRADFIATLQKVAGERPACMSQPAPGTAPMPTPPRSTSDPYGIHSLFDAYIPGCWEPWKQTYWEDWFKRGGTMQDFVATLAAEAARRPACLR